MIIFYFNKILLYIHVIHLQNRACLVDCNDNYIRIGICIIRDTRRCNVMLITFHLFCDDTIIEP